MDQYSIRPRVGFLESIKSVFKQYTKYSGRSRRSEFWYFTIINNIIQLTLIIIMIATIEKKKVHLILILMYTIIHIIK